MLWSLLRVGVVEASCKQDSKSSEILSATLILEPSTGGDLQIHSGGSRAVEQIKTRTTGESWSIKELIDDVLPDLYCAVDLSIPDTQFRFVTNGHCARWAAFQDFIALLPAPSAAGVVAVPETPLPIWLWKGGAATASAAFDEIVAIIRQAKTVEKESPQETRLKTHHLLTKFGLLERQETDDVATRIDRWLDGLVPAIETRDQIRDSLLLEMARRSTAGNARITIQELCQARGLDATPLHDWRTHHAKATARTNDDLQRRGYNAASDVRFHRAPPASAWPSTRSILVLTGESGVGKTWSGFAFLLELLARGHVALMVPSKGNVDGDAEAAATALWNDVVGHDVALPLGRIRERLKKVGVNQSVYFLFDGISNCREAEELALLQWETWRFYPILTCSPDVAEAVQRVGRDRVHVIDVSRFSPEELRRFLRRVAGVDWTQIPSGITDTLRLPLLASIYADLATTDGWLPSHEYELYERMWQRLLTGEQGRFPSDATSLRSAALSFLRGGRYPWSPEDFGTPGECDARLTRLVRSGWLRPVRPSFYEVPHDRFLNWAAATALVSELDSGRLSEDALPLQLVELNSRSHPQKQRLGYVTMDVLWQLCAPNRPTQSAAEKVLMALEREAEWGDQTLYEQHLPTLGARALPVAFARLRVAASTNTLTATHLVRGLASLRVPTVVESALRDLGDASPHVRRVAARLLTQVPTADALPGLWHLHCEQDKDPAPFLQEWEQAHPYTTGQETMAALRATVPMNPRWLSDAITSADPDREPVHDLAYLLAGLRDARDRWIEQKAALFQKVAPNRQRCLAMNIQAHRDMTSLDWLELHVREKTDLLGAVALRALAHLDPDRALISLDSLPQDDLYLTRYWSLGELLLRRPEACCEWLLRRLGREPNPWAFASCIQGLENRVSPQVLDFLLDALPDVVDKDLDSPKEGDRLSALYHPLRQLAAVSRLDLLACFRHRRGGRLAQALTRWLAAVNEGPMLDDMTAQAMELLGRIGGGEYGLAIARLLQSDDRFERLRAYKAAKRQVSPEVLHLLCEATLKDELWNGNAVEQGFAATAIAAAGEWRHVIAYIVRHGLRTFISVTDHRLLDAPLDDAAIQPALEGLEANGMTPGVAMALAFGSRAEYLPRIREALLRAESPAEVAAYTVALRWLKDSDASNVDAIRPLLADRDLGYQAIDGLFENESDAALEALIHHAQTSRDLSLACDLLRDPRTHPRAAAVLNEALESAQTGPFMRALDLALSTQAARDVLTAVIERQEVRDFLHQVAFRNEGASWFLGEKETAIRALSAVKDGGAFEAARAAFLDPRTPDRWTYPYILGHIDAAAALALFFERAQVESNQGVLWAMSRAMARWDCMATLRAAFAGSARTRLAAARLAGRLPPEAWLIEAVEAARNEHDAGVARAADKALIWLWQGKWAEDLSVALAVETDQTHAWTLLEALLETGDPGDAGQPLPPWTVALRGLPLTMLQRLDEGLRERRRKVRDLGKKDERD